MSQYFLRYQSDPVFCGFAKDSLFSSEIDDWTIRDELTPTDKVRNDLPLKEYIIILEKEIEFKGDAEKQRGELHDFREEAFDLIRELKWVWPLVFGRLQLASDENYGRNAPDCWNANSRDLFDTLYPEKPKVSISFGTSKWFILPYNPLDRLFRAHTAYRKAPDHIKTLVEFHYDALDSNEHAAMFILAKALEIVRGILPGDNYRQKMDALPPEVRERLSKDLSWLFMIANNRLDIRHAVNKHPSRLILHSKTTELEKSDFFSNALMLIQAVIEEKLGLDAFPTKGNTYTISDHFIL